MGNKSACRKRAHIVVVSYLINIFEEKKKNSTFLMANWGDEEEHYLRSEGPRNTRTHNSRTIKRHDEWWRITYSYFIRYAVYKKDMLTYVSTQKVLVLCTYTHVSYLSTFVLCKVQTASAFERREYNARHFAGEEVKLDREENVPIRQEKRRASDCRQCNCEGGIFSVNSVEKLWIRERRR